MLPDDSLQDLRLLTADNLDQTCPFSLLLVGQPLLRDRLAEPLHYALWQRIGVKLRLHPLSELEVAPFIQRHLTAAGASSDIFLPEAISDIFHHSRGIHRIVQNIAVDSMIVAMEAHANRVDSQAVSQAIIDMELNS
jgi:type II secretory pathway predicted ATPase ExeA